VVGSDDLLELLNAVATGVSSPEDAATRLQSTSFVDLGRMTLDVGRKHRTGGPEVIYGEGKDIGQLELIAEALAKRSERALFTRLSLEKAEEILRVLPGSEYLERSRTLTWEPDAREGDEEEERECPLVVVSAGASDAPVAEEAVVTAEFLGVATKTVFDCGVAGLHRVLARLEVLERARVIIAVAGMDGVLPTVIAGLVRAPIIAVPTSVGYGPGSGGLTPLLCMLNSCAPGLTVVNVDNGVGAAFAAARILRVGKDST